MQTAEGLSKPVDKHQACAVQWIKQTCLRQGIHADRGRAMTSKPVTLFLADWSVTKTHSVRMFPMTIPPWRCNSRS